MNSQINLTNLPSQLKKFLIFYLIVISLGVTLGLVYVADTTSMKQNGIVERWKGSPQSGEEIPEQYEKGFSEMLMTTHNHIIGFSFIFLQIGFIFYFNSIIKGFWKSFLMIEPFVSIVFTFGSIWLMRFYSTQFVYLIIISAVTMYTAFFVMVIFSIYDLAKKRLNGFSESSSMKP